ncbi:MAG: carbohydrate-binding domain-containing protein [Clostridia bacterium]
MNMKRIISTIGVIAVVSASIVIPHVSAKEVTVKLDGEVVECPTPARVENGSTMIPMRAIFEAFGMDVVWNDTEKTVTATKDNDTVQLTIGKNVIEVNGEEIEIPVAPYIDGGYTLVPVRAVSEGLNAKVSWNGYTDEVSIVTEDFSFDEDTWKDNVGSINLSDLTYTGEGVTVIENVVVINKGGDFELTGENADAMVYVNTYEKVKLRLNGVNLTNTTGPAIFFDNCEKALITISKDSENFITDGQEYSSDAKAAIFANDDIEIKGLGTLNVTSKSHHGIASDDDIKIEEGTIIINAEEKDGIHANNTVKIQGGSVTVTAFGDGIQAEEDVVIEGGSVNITTTGTVTESGKSGEFFGRGEKPQRNMGEEMPDMGNNMTPSEGFNGERQKGNRMEQAMPQGENMTPPEGEQKAFHEGENMTPPGWNMTPPQGESVTEENTSDTSSTKGIKAETDITISGGNIVVNSADDAIHCSGTVNLTGGEITLESDKGKGISAHGDLTINDGVVTVTKSTEGIESKANFMINGGTITVTASDDGINAGGTNSRDVGANTGHDLTINGGKIYVNASGDGIDSNGAIIINGGDIVVEGPTNSGNGALDSGGVINVNGGTIIALGASGMAEMPNNTSKQPSFKVVTEANILEGSLITIKNSKGEEIYSYTTVKVGNSIVFSSDKLNLGETYTVRAGESEYSLTLENITTTLGGQMGGFGGKRW